MQLVNRENGLKRTTALMLLATLATGLLHHVDHVLRADHSGWSFRADVNPFTFSLLAYPILLFALLGPLRLFRWRWAGLAVGTMATVYAHSQIETPEMQYAMWAFNRSLEPALWDIRNLCGIQSGPIGWIAATVSMLLNILLVTTTIAMSADGLSRLDTTLPSPKAGA